MNIRITELSDYLGLSRPTLYKFLEQYEMGKVKGINKDVLKLFRYIDGTSNIGKTNVISFILNNINSKLDSQERGGNSSSVYGLIEKTTPSKREFVINILESGLIDNLIPYLNECFEISKKQDMIEDDYEAITKLVLFQDEISNGKKPTRIQIEKVKKMTRSVE